MALNLWLNTHLPQLPNHPRHWDALQPDGCLRGPMVERDPERLRQELLQQREQVRGRVQGRLQARERNLHCSGQKVE